MNKSPNEHLKINSLNRNTEAFQDQRREAARKKAEIMLQHSIIDIAGMSTDDIQKLLYEFQVHQLELKIQHEELSRAHQEMTSSRDTYARLYDLSPVGYVTLSETGNIQKANIAAATLLGCPREELINKRLGKFIHPSDQDNYYLFIHQLLAQKAGQALNESIKNASSDPPTDLECKYFQLGADIAQSGDKGKILTIECQARIVYNDKNVLQICLTLNNVTERKQAQETIAYLNEKLEETVRRQTTELIVSNLSLMKKVEELRRSKHQLLEREAKLNSIFNASVEGIITINVSNVIVSANAAVETIFGYKPEELIGHNIYKLILSPPKDISDGNFSHAANLRGQIQEVEGLHKNGSVVPLDLSVAEFSIDNAHFFTHIVRDVSSRKQREQQDKEHLDELAHVTRLGLMGEMASGIAHEVNQPLSAISSYTQVSLNLINSKEPDLAKLAETLYKTQQQALRAGRIIHRMREFVKSQTKHRATADINALIHNAADLCLAELKQSGIELALKLEPNLLPVYVDHIQIEQVIINLLRNSTDALKSLPAGQQRQISIQSQLTLNNGIQVRVKDNGAGLDKEQQQKILTPFYTTKADGMGMGLSITRSIVEAHDGTLHFNSELGKGTTFYFTLPIEKKPDQNSQDSPVTAVNY